MKYGYLILGIVLVGCGMPSPDDAMPDDPMRTMKTKGTAPAPDKAMAAKSGQSLDHLERGYAVFNAKCIECHIPRIPVNPSNPNWHATMLGMAWNAGLSEANERELIDYMRAAGGK